MATKANAISNRLRQIRDRSRPTTKARSAGHEAGVNGGGKVDHMGGSIVGLRLS